MIACDREATLLLISGWALLTDTGWTLLDASTGDASTWIPATEDEAAALEATLLALPAVARIHRGLVDQADGHRASCASLRPNECNCKGVTP